MLKAIFIVVSLAHNLAGYDSLTNYARNIRNIGWRRHGFISPVSI
jgi:hypothetical protein